MIRACCIGRNNVDIFLNNNMVYPGGNCNNVAAGLAKEGHSVSLITNVGNDMLGKLQLDAVKKLGVNCSGSNVVDDQTAWCMIRHENGDRLFVKSDTSIDKRHPISLKDIEKIDSSCYDVIYTCSDSISALSEELFVALKQKGIPVCCDFSARWQAEHVEYLCKYVDCVYLSCEKYTLEETEALLTRFCKAGCSIAVGTRGTYGSVAYDGKTMHRQCAYNFKIKDTLGAGDAFLSSFTAHYIQGKKELTLWCKELPDSQQKNQLKDDYDSVLIDYSLQSAAIFAAKTCMEYGGFGNGIKFEKMMIGEG